MRIGINFPGLETCCSRLIWLVLIVMPLFILSGCEDSPDMDPSLVRKKIVTERYEAKAPILVAVVWDSRDQDYLNGATLAAEEINANGGVNGRPIELKYVDEMHFMTSWQVKRSKAEGRYRNAVQEAGTNMAKSVTADPNVALVIGHTQSEAALPALMVYQDEGLLFFQTGNSDSRLMWSADDLYFQLMPEDVELAKTMVNKMKTLKWDTVYFVYVMNRHYEQLVELIKSQMSKEGIRFAGASSITQSILESPRASSRLQSSLADLRESDVDAFVLLTQASVGSDIIRKSRALGIQQPFIGLTYFDNPEFYGTVGEGGIDTRIVSLRSDGYQFDAFSKIYEKRFPGKHASVNAAGGYDTIHLYVESVLSAGNPDPFLVSHALHFKLPYWHGVLGTYSFKYGANTHLKYHIRKLVQNKDETPRFVPNDTE